MSAQTVLDPTNDLVEQAKRVLPGGSFGNMPAEVVLKEGKGGRIWDEAGREYVDYLLGSGPMFVGHAHPSPRRSAMPCPVRIKCASSAPAPKPISTPCAPSAPSASATRS